MSGQEILLIGAIVIGIFIAIRFFGAMLGSFVGILAWLFRILVPLAVMVIILWLLNEFVLGWW